MGAASVRGPERGRLRRHHARAGPHPAEVGRGGTRLTDLAEQALVANRPRVTPGRPAGARPRLRPPRARPDQRTRAPRADGRERGRPSSRWRGRSRPRSEADRWTAHLSDEAAPATARGSRAAARDHRSVRLTGAGPLGGSRVEAVPRTLAGVPDARPAADRCRRAACAGGRPVLRTLPTDAKDAALAAMADALVERTDEVLAANAADVEAAAPTARPSRSSTGCGWTPTGSPGWPPRCASWSPCPTRSATSSAARGCPTGCSCGRSGCRSAWSGSSTRPAQRDRRRRRALPQERQRGAAARLGVGLPHQHRAGRRPHRGRYEGGLPDGSVELLPADRGVGRASC